MYVAVPDSMFVDGSLFGEGGRREAENGQRRSRNDN